MEPQFDPAQVSQLLDLAVAMSSAQAKVTGSPKLDLSGLMAALAVSQREGRESFLHGSSVGWRNGHRSQEAQNNQEDTKNQESHQERSHHIQEERKNLTLGNTSFLHSTKQQEVGVVAGKKAIFESSSSSTKSSSSSASSSPGLGRKSTSFTLPRSSPTLTIAPSKISSVTPPKSPSITPPKMPPKPFQSQSVSPPKLSPQSTVSRPKPFQPPSLTAYEPSQIENVITPKPTQFSSVTQPFHSSGSVQGKNGIHNVPSPVPVCVPPSQVQSVASRDSSSIQSLSDRKAMFECMSVGSECGPSLPVATVFGKKEGKNGSKEWKKEGLKEERGDIVSGRGESQIVTGKEDGNIVTRKEDAKMVIGKELSKLVSKKEEFKVDIASKTEKAKDVENKDTSLRALLNTGDDQVYQFVNILTKLVSERERETGDGRLDMGGLLEALSSVEGIQVQEKDSLPAVETEKVSHGRSKEQRKPRLVSSSPLGEEEEGQEVLQSWQEALKGARRPGGVSSRSNSEDTVLARPAIATLGPPLPPRASPTPGPHVCPSLPPPPPPLPSVPPPTLQRPSHIKPSSSSTSTTSNASTSSSMTSNSSSSSSSTSSVPFNQEKSSIIGELKNILNEDGKISSEREMRGYKLPQPDIGRVVDTSNPQDPTVKRIVYSHYREMLKSYRAAQT